MTIRLFFALFALSFIFPLSTSAQSCPVEPGSAVSPESTNAVYYIAEDCSKRPIKNPDVFFSHFVSWNDVITVPDSTLTTFPDNPLSFLPWGTRRTFAWGSLIKTVDDPSIYLITSENERYRITSEQVFLDLGYQWSWVEDVMPGVMNLFSTAGNIDTYTNLPHGYVYIEPNTPNVYMVTTPEGGSPGEQFKTRFNTMSEIVAAGYRTDRIPTPTVFFDFVETEPEESRDEKRITQAKQLQTALELYYADHRAYPVGTYRIGGVDAACLGTNGFRSAATCNAPIMTIVPSDPGGNTWIYESQQGGASYVVTLSLDSFLNGLPGGTNYLTPTGFRNDYPAVPVTEPTPTPGYNTSNGILFSEDFETADLTCAAYDQRRDTNAPDCDYTGTVLAGSQSVEITDSESLVCANCFDPQPELWVSMLVRQEADFSDAWLPFQPIVGDAIDYNYSRTGGMLAITAIHEPGKRLLTLTCGLGGTGETYDIPHIELQNNRTYRVIFNYNWETRRGTLDVWDYQYGTTIDTAVINCPASANDMNPHLGPHTYPTGFASEGFPAGGPSGRAIQDDIIVATSRGALGLSE